MSNYLETQISGTSHKRAKSITISNPYMETAVVTFHEEVVHHLGENLVKQGSGALSITVDLDDVVEILNPLTGESTGQFMSMAQGYAFLYSAYLKYALERDANLAQPEGPEEPEE